MAKFVIECPVCGKYTEAKTGFFAKKKINCACGNVIDVRTDRMTSRVCGYCGNTVVFDQADGREAKCPVCSKPINTLEDMRNRQEFSCAQCGIRLSVARGARTFTCPVCDRVNDVAERLVSESIREDGLASIIKYEGDNETFIWKHPIEDFNYGSQLIVHESQEAIFFRDGQALDLFGPGRYTLETQQLPLLEKLYKLPTDTEGTFHSEVYFINRTTQMSIKWGTPDKVRFIDPLTGVPLEIGASGYMNLQVENSRKLLVKLVGTMGGISWEDNSGFTKSLQESFRPLIANAVKTNLAAVIKDNAIDLLEIDEKLDVISENLRGKINAGFEEYGLTIPQFYVSSVVLPENDPNFKRIRELHTITLQTRVLQAEATVKTAQAQSETMYRTAQEQSKAAIEAAHREAELQRQTTQTEVARMEAERTVIQAQAEAQAKRMDGLTEAEIMRAKGYSEKDVLQADVQKAYAQSLGTMGPLVTGGSGSSGSGVVGDMIGLSVGMAAAQAIMPQVNGMVQNLNPQAGAFGAAPAPGTAPASMPGVASAAPASGSAAASPATGLETWDCTCGNKGIVGFFCNMCGAKKPAAPGAETWDCACGNKGIIGNFCNLCGARKPAAPETWDCTCGNKGIIGNFCNLCGKKRGE